MSKTADEVVGEIFEEATAEPELEPVASALKEAWEAGTWTDAVIDSKLQQLRSGS